MVEAAARQGADAGVWATLRMSQYLGCLSTSLAEPWWGGSQSARGLFQHKP